MLENLVNKNRILIGLLLISILTFSFYTNLDYVLLTIIAILFLYDLIYSKIFNNFSLILISILAIFLFIILKVLNLFTPILYYFYFISLICSLFLHQYKRYFFLLFVIFNLAFIFLLVELNRNLFYLAIIISFFNDTTAYIFGNLLKGPLIAPTISPKKTWSGTIISIFFSSLVLVYLDFNIFFSFIASLSLYFGDLYFSYIKRKFLLKDYSNLLLSHGGLLDRFDSILPINFLFYVYFSFFI